MIKNNKQNKQMEMQKIEERINEIRDSRAKTQISREELARRMKITKEELNMFEKNPTTEGKGGVIQLSQEYGIAPEKILRSYQNLHKRFEGESFWCEIQNINKKAEKYLSENSQDTDNELLKQTVDRIKLLAAKLTAKPNVVFVGRSDSGKSTMINNLLGKNILPTNWQPVTSIVVHIKHIDDRPEYMNEYPLWIMKCDENGKLWDDTRLIDEEYTKSMAVACGNENLLESYGTVEGEMYQVQEGLYSAVMFVDSDILKHCDILDVPGFTGGRPADEYAAGQAFEKADAVVYLSQANSFMCSEDFVYLKEAIRCLPVLEDNCDPYTAKLANLFVVASQADIMEEDILNKTSKILLNGCERFYNTLDEEFWKERENISGDFYSLDDLFNRFFVYSAKGSTLSVELEDALKHTLEIMPEILKDDIIYSLNTGKKQICNELEELFETEQAILNKHSAAKHEYERRIAEEIKVKGQLEDRKNLMLKKLTRSRNLSKDKFVTEFNNLFETGKLHELIKTRNVKNTKASREEFLSYISSRLNRVFMNSVVEEIKVLETEFEQYTNSCQTVFNQINMERIEKKCQFDVKFNVKRAFASGAAGAAAYGALSAWTASLGNLGGYIAVAKATSLMAAIGVHVGGTAAAISAVHALGGPVVWSIGLATLVGTTIYGLCGGGWKHEFAKYICKEVKKNSLLNECIATIDKVWDETEAAFKQGAQNIQDEWDKQTTKLKYATNADSVDALQKNVNQIKETIHIVKNCPVEG